jgi:hypothetical protein
MLEALKTIGLVLGAMVGTMVVIGAFLAIVYWLLALVRRGSKARRVGLSAIWNTSMLDWLMPHMDHYRGKSGDKRKKK